MKVKVNWINGVDDAFVSMFISKRNWTPELDKEIRSIVRAVSDPSGGFVGGYHGNQYQKWMESLLKMGKKHITVLRFINISLMTEGMHRAGQDDIDAHAMRFNNRIIRTSTRTVFHPNEKSEFYQGKVLTLSEVLEGLGIDLPEVYEQDGKRFVKKPHGYVLEEYKDNKDVNRGLYHLMLPSNFVAQINLCEWAHVYQQRNEMGGANPEVKIWAESVQEQIMEKIPQITKEWILSVEN